MSGPLDYDRTNARALFDAAVGVDMLELYRRFLAAIPREAPGAVSTVPSGFP
jgi:hypothetical protein